MPILKLYKTLIMIGMVVGPLYWLMLTEDGKRRTDTLMLWLAGGDPVDINFKVLDRQYREEDWKKVYPDLSWQCQQQDSPFGERICYTEISAYNGIPSRYLSVFFHNGTTNALKLVYRNQYHSEVGLDLQKQLGVPHLAQPASQDIPQGAQAVLEWATDDGTVLLKKELDSGEEEAALLWLPYKL